MNRREFLWVPVLLASWQTAGAHTPYRQWVVYRKKHLLIGAHRADPTTYDLAKKLAAVLAHSLPKSRCRVARAPTAQRLASLIGTDQLDVAVLDTADAIAMQSGSGRFEPYGPISIRQLAGIGGRLLVAHERLPARHAWLIAATLDQTRTTDRRRLDQDPDVSWHPGALSFLRGKPQPGSE
ncbi:hypothetical protein [Anderseniella sp. Alg231-50]|uniref:hypothetical protein n=1 Tax=Anderseniella sp. Alg231-50 TaxID=1922226 RepID=UPI000D5611BD